MPSSKTLSSLKLLLAALLLVPLAALAARQAELRNAEVAVMEGLSSKQVGEAVERALIGRRWIVTDRKANSCEATQMTRGLTAKVSVQWDAKTIRIKHLSSDGLSYEVKNGVEYIHPNYNKWIGNLEKDLPVFMMRVKAGQ